MVDFKKELFDMQDKSYRDFQSALMPTVNADKVIGVRIPRLRRFAKDVDISVALEFMNQLPHDYYEEDNLHAFLIEKIRDIDACFNALDRFLPYVDNWATCDMMSPKAITKDKSRLLIKAYQWIGSDYTYTVRYGIGVLMKHFLDEDFSLEYADKVASVVSDEYYVNMMCAWYFATALAKEPESILPYLENKRLDAWVHNKTISKACESYRIDKNTKEYLKTLRIK